MFQVDAAVISQVHSDDGRESLPPGDFIRVMLIGADEDDGLPRALVLVERAASVRSKELDKLLVEPRARGRRDGDTEDLLQLVDRAGRARATGDDFALWAGVDHAFDRILCLVQQPGGA